MNLGAAPAFGLLVLLMTGPALAGPCDGTQPWISVEIADALGDAAFRENLGVQLSAGLARRGIDVCPPSTRGEPIARVNFGAGSGDQVAITVRAYDELTEKEVARAIDLSTLPRDAWALSLAVAADEVLRASWAELALRSAPPPKREVPPAVRASVRDSIRPDLLPPRNSEAARLGVGAVFAAEHYTAGHTQLGADARIGAELLPRLSLRLGIGLRGGQQVESENGAIRSSAIVVGAGPAYDVVRVSTWLGVSVLLRLDATRIELRGDATSSARDASGSATALYATGGAALWIAPDPALRFTAELTGGAPLKSAVATDDGRRVTGLSGAGLGVALGVEGRL